MTAPWTVGQDALIVRRDEAWPAVVTRVGRKYVYATTTADHDDDPGPGPERRFHLESGAEDGFSYIGPRLTTPEREAQRQRDEAVRWAVLEAGWMPRNYPVRPMSEWRAVATALGVMPEQEER